MEQLTRYSCNSEGEPQSPQSVAAEKSTAPSAFTKKWFDGPIPRYSCTLATNV